MNQLASQQWVSFQEADSGIFVYGQVNVRGCGISCNIKGEAVEDVKGRGIWPKQEVDRYVVKDSYDKWDKKEFVYESQGEGGFNMRGMKSWELDENFNYSSEKVSYRCCTERSARQRLGMRPS